jgi:hypothetical protein
MFFNVRGIIIYKNIPCQYLLKNYNLHVKKSTMPTDKPKILLVLDDDLFKAIDNFRFDNRIESRSEAVRIILKEGLKAIKAKPPKKAKS